MCYRQLLQFTFGIILSVLACAPAAAQIEGLKGRIPTDANAVVIINTEKLFGSAAAQRERWEARRKAAFDAGLTFLSPKTQGVVIAAKIDLEFGKTVWELAQVRLSEPASIPAVAARFGGEVDTIESRSAARLPNDSLVVAMQDNVLASYTPANRQDVARWLRSTDTWSSEKSLSPYINQAFRYVEEGGTPIIMAIDMQGALSAPRIEQTLKRESLEGLHADNLTAVSKTLSGIHGVMLGVTVGEKPFGSIRVDFDSETSALIPFGKQLLISVLTRQESMIDDFNDWKLTSEGNSLFLKGNLSTSGLRRIMSVLELPASLSESIDLAKQSGSEDPEMLARLASQSYFKSITTLLDDLKGEKKGGGSVTTGGVAIWYDKYARRIDNLPILNVDDELLAYGRDVSELLRGGETVMRSVGVQSRLRTGVNDGFTAYESYSEYRGYGGYRAGYTPTYAGARYANREKGRTDAVIRSQERARGVAGAQQMWQTIETATADVRRAMTQKYDSEF